MITKGSPPIEQINARAKMVSLPSGEAAVHFAARHFINCAIAAIREKGLFSVALSGGSTPAAIYRMLAEEFASALDWSKVLFFFGDERPVPPDHHDSNYRMALESGIEKLAAPLQVFRMHAETDIEVNALAYEHLIKERAGGHFDLIMAGIGEDGHTLSLFPGSTALGVEDRLVVPNYVDKLKTWRMTCTFPLLNSCTHIAVHVLGEKKRAILHNLLRGPYKPDLYPAMRIGTNAHPALWITDLEV